MTVIYRCPACSLEHKRTFASRSEVLRDRWLLCDACAVKPARKPARKQARKPARKEA